MTKNGCNLDKLIDFRKAVHQHAEGGFKEFETQKRVREVLLSFGIENENITDCATTGLVVDIKGKMEGEFHAVENTVKVVAFRADMDALPIPENNDHLPYKT